MCLALAVLLLALDLPARSRRAAVAAMAALCFLVGAALIWRDFHWFTDVVAGWALAALIVLAVLRLAGPGTAARRGNSGSESSAVTSEAVTGTREESDDSARA